MKYIVANWKMNMNEQSIRDWFLEFLKLYQQKENIKIILCVSYPYLKLVKNLIDNAGVKVCIAAQDVSLYERGAHTGEVGGFQLKEYCQYVLVGHSERNESRDVVLKKRDLVLAAGLAPIVCFTSHDELEKSYVKEALLAWEDPQNISKNGVYFEKPQEEIAAMFSEYKKLKPEATILYGGSVNRENIKAVATIENVSGILPGNASLNPKHFIDLVQAFY